MISQGNVTDDAIYITLLLYLLDQIRLDYIISSIETTKCSLAFKKCKKSRKSNQDSPILSLQCSHIDSYHYVPPLNTKIV